MIKKLFVFAAMALAYAGQASAQEWVRIANSNGGDIYSAKSGSFELTRNKAGRQIAVVVGSTYWSAKKQYTYAKWYVTADDCDAGMGKLVVLQVNGEFDWDTDFVKGGQSISAGVADTICALYDEAKKRQQSRGL